VQRHRIGHELVITAEGSPVSDHNGIQRKYLYGRCPSASRSGRDAAGETGGSLEQMARLRNSSLGSRAEAGVSVGWMVRD
jgi:hypothetical protein